METEKRRGRVYGYSCRSAQSDQKRGSSAPKTTMEIDPGVHHLWLSNGNETRTREAGENGTEESTGLTPLAILKRADIELKTSHDRHWRVRKESLVSFFKLCYRYPMKRLRQRHSFRLFPPESTWV